MQIMLVLLIFIVFALLSNTILITPFYNMAKKRRLIEMVEIMNSFDGEYEENVETIYDIEEKLDARILIYDDDTVIYLSTGRVIQGQFISDFKPVPRGKNAMTGSDHMKKPRSILINSIPKIIDESRLDEINSNTTILTFTAMDRSKYLYLETVLDDGTYMNVVVEMQSLTEAIRIFNVFLSASAVIYMLIATYISYLMSKKFVEPIQNMNAVTKKIAALDFSDSVEIKTQDELKELGDNINTLSVNLEDTIEELTHELQNARRLEKLRKNFVSTVSHELKSPISLLQGYAIGLTSDVCKEKEKRDYYATVIAEESEHLGELVNELMDLTQLEAGYITLHKEEFEVSDFLSGILEKYKAANPDINIKYLKPYPKLQVEGDIKLLERVMSNYLSNAIRHVDDKKLIEIESLLKDDHVEVSVFNTGAHIKDESINEIWNSFYRADDTGSRSKGGHGLGLAIVKNIQLAHGMGYSVQNVAGGVKFSFGIKSSG